MSELKDALDELQALHPTWMFRDCWDELKRTRPELMSWRDLEKPRDRLAALRREQAEQKTNHAGVRASASTNNTNIIQAEIDRIRQANPKLSFQSAWARLRQQRPELFSAGYQRPERPVRDWTSSPIPPGTPNSDRMFQRPVTAGKPELAQFKRKFRAVAAKELKDKVAVIQAASPGHELSGGLVGVAPA
jgi:hypothetical protein